MVTQMAMAHFKWNDPYWILVSQGAYISGKPGNLREIINSGKLREFKIYSGYQIYA